MEWCEGLGQGQQQRRLQRLTWRQQSHTSGRDQATSWGGHEGAKATQTAPTRDARSKLKVTADCERDSVSKGFSL